MTTHQQRIVRRILPWAVTFGLLAVWELVCRTFHVPEFILPPPSAVAAALVQYDAVIIDTPGFRSQATLACLSVTDFVLVPVKPSPFDVDRMLDTLNVLINGVSGQRPVFRCVLTQTTRESVIAKHIRSELAEAGFPVLDSEMTNRVVYAEAALWGATPNLLDQKSPAAREIAAIADEVAQICESMTHVKRAASA